MLPKASRLTLGADFRLAGRSGRRAGATNLVVHLAVDPLGGSKRVGFVVSKAVGNAVVRNRVRRRLRHLVREHLNGLPDSGVLVIRALPASAEASYGDLDRDLAKALGKVLQTAPPRVAS